ncbi:MAG: ABC transporter substrate-binding protein [Candidatus Eisenbacteria bacterium]
MPDPRIVSYTDVLGHDIQWSTPPQRIVSLSPNITEILFALEAGEAVVGVTRFCNYPPQVDQLPKVGGVVDPSLEAILELNPDLVLATRGNPLEFIESLVELGIPVFALETRGTIEQLIVSVREIGAVTGRNREAAVLIQDLQEQWRVVLRVTRDLPPESRPRVYYGELDGAFWTAGPGSYIHSLIEDAGAENVAWQAPSAWCALSLEVIVAGDPEVYLGTYAGPDTPEARTAAEAEVRTFLQTHPVWSQTTLGRNPRIFMVQEDRLLRPGPRVFAVLRELARFLHPDLRI